MTVRILGTPAVKKRSVWLGENRTSVSMEDEFWNAFKEIAQARGLYIQDLLAQVWRDKANNISMSGAVRVFVLKDALNTINQLRPTKAA